jgi:hypothetical protein
MHKFIHILLHTLEHGLHIFPFLFIAFLIIEYIEHKLKKKNLNAIKKAGKTGPFIGGLLGLLPQCGFGVVVTNLYVTKVVSLGTLISIYLSTSDEMLPILISQNVQTNEIIKILGSKFLIGMTCGFIIDLIFRKKNTGKIDSKICEEEHCHCDKENIFLSSLIHTTKTILFILLVSFILNIIIESYGTDVINKIFMKNSILSPLISSLIGLIPNCASSVVLTELYLQGVLSFGTLIAGVLTGSGVAILVLFKTNKNLKENIFILSLLYLIGITSGIIINILM